MCPLTTGGTASNIAPGDICATNWDAVLELAGRAGQVFVAGFGEPFCNSRCIEFLRELDARGVKTSLVTNGVAVTPSRAAEIASIQSIEHINVSIDSPDADCYRSIRGGRLDQALRGLANVLAAIDDPLRVSVSSVAMSTNVRTLVSFPPLLESMGVRNYIIQGLWDYNDYCLDSRLSGDRELKGILGGVVADGARRGIDVQLTLGDRSITELDQPELAAQRYYVPGSTEPARTRQCMLPWELPYVDKDGRVFSCCYAASVGSPELGRMEKSTFDEIWNGSPYSQFRRELVGGNSMPGVCRGCTAVPLGPHPLSLYSGRLESVAVDGPGRLRVAVRNTGSVPWELGSVLIGTCRPRDRRSPAADPSWIRENRPCTFDEPRVPPGEVATFSFPVAMMPDGKTAHFAVVVEHVCWLPTTEFSLP